ncbi:hypothetical protein LINGRAHAP2_LOCUS30742 [Linum grandiflorum]
MYDPIVEMAKKEKSRRFTENSVHVIPVVLLVCGLIFWFFHNPSLTLRSDFSRLYFLLISCVVRTVLTRRSGSRCSVCCWSIWFLLIFGY